MKIGENLRKARIKRNLTQEDLAGALGISQRAYSKIENDQVQLKIERLEEIAKLLNVEIAQLLDDKNSQYFENVSYSQIGSGRVVNHTSDKEHELYEKLLKKQADEIDYLKGIINVLSK